MQLQKPLAKVSFTSNGASYSTGVLTRATQSGRGLIGLLAQISAHLSNLIAIEIDGGHTLDIAAVGDLITLVVEPIANSPVRDQNLAIAPGRPCDGAEWRSPGASR